MESACGVPSVADGGAASDAGGAFDSGVKVDAGQRMGDAGSTTLDDGGAPLIEDMYGGCLAFASCVGDLRGTWVRTARCASASNPFGSFCADSTVVSFSGHSRSRIEITETQFIETSSSDHLLVANLPSQCLTTSQMSCSGIVSGNQDSCAVAPAGRTGCDCSSMRSFAPLTTTATWNVSGGKLTVRLENGSTYEYSSCVKAGSPDTLQLGNSAGVVDTYVRL